VHGEQTVPTEDVQGAERLDPYSTVKLPLTRAGSFEL